MVIYSATLTLDDLADACDGIPAVYLNGTPTLVEGRKRRFVGVTLRAAGDERPVDWREHDDTASNGTPMGGPQAKSMPQHATYAEHGRWMANVLDVDPDARIKSAINDFHGRADFHRQTANAYRNVREGTNR